MKKIKLFGLGLLLALLSLSCSKDGEPTASPTSLILTKRVNERDPVYSDIGKDTYFTYDGNKIVSSIYDGKYKDVYTYTGNFITKIEEFSSEKLTNTIDFTYTNGKLTSVLEKEPLYPSKITNYVHNSDGTVSYSSTSGKGKLTFKDGNLMEDASETNGTETYEYDTKNNPFKNILGISALLYNAKGGILFNASKNNYIKNTDKYNGVTSILTTSTITYNSDGYPIEDKEYWTGGTDYTFYKYYYE